MDWLYEWIQNIAFYMIMVSVVLKVLPGKQYNKYIQFYSGIILILLVFLPIIRIAGAEKDIFEIYKNNEYIQEKKEMELMEKYFTEADLIEFIPEEYIEESEEENENIQIETIRIGK